MSRADAGRVFHFLFPTSDLDRFGACCEEAARMKAHGRVRVDVSGVASPAHFEKPAGGSAWHEYASFNSSLYKFFPHPEIAGHIPADWVAQNRRLLLEKAEIVRRLGFEAGFKSHEPPLMPESYFEAYPHLRGPRIDHPRRSRREEFAPCVDQEQALAQFEWMMAELKRNVPELTSFAFSTNDAGGGFCWAAAQYAGPNGPRHCQGRPVGARVRGLLDALQRGAESSGGPIRVRIDHANFWSNERSLVEAALPGYASFLSNMPNLVVQRFSTADTYPVQGLFDPLALFASLDGLADPERTSVNLWFGTYWSCDTAESVRHTLEVVEDVLRRPPKRLLGRLQRLREYAARWSDEARAEDLFEAFHEAHDAVRAVNTAGPPFSTCYQGLTMRHFTRPLVFKPELLTTEEESFFLPYVFNVRQSEARCDYTDSHGSKMTVAPIARAFDESLARVRRAAAGIESCADGLEGVRLRRVAGSLRVWAGIQRSCRNFFFGQQIRDRNREALAGPPRIPPKAGSWDGHPDILPWNELMRDEFDNAQEMIRVLESGGPDLLARSVSPRDEDSFLLGPDVIGALRKKCKVMRAHWLDVESYLAPPHK